MQESRILITYDKDFGELVFAGQRAVATILIRLRKASVDDTVQAFMRAVDNVENLEHNFTVIERGRIRMTPLP